LSQLASFEPFLTWLGLAQLEKLELTRKLSQLVQSFSHHQLCNQIFSSHVWNVCQVDGAYAVPQILTCVAWRDQLFNLFIIYSFAMKLSLFSFPFFLF
jgi:hypothetical protein